MKKRIFSFFCLILMLMPLVLTSCGEGGTDTTTTGEENLYVKPCTLNFYIVTDSMTNESRAAQALMQEEFNKYARDMFKTQVQFVFCTAEDYLNRVTSALETAASIDGSSASQKFESAEVETAVDDRGDTFEVYPTPYNNQVDILLINGKSVYNKLKPHLANITEPLDQFPEIRQRVNSNLINGAKDGNDFFAVPNNVVIGSYKYVLVNKDIAFRFQYAKTEDRFMTSGAKPLLSYDALRLLAQQVQTSKDNADEDYTALIDQLGVSEIYPMDRAFDFPTVTFLPYGEEETLFGVMYDYDTTFGDKIALNNVLQLDTGNNIYKSSYQKHLALMIEAKSNGYYPEAADEAEAYAIRYMEGSYVDREAYQDDYFVYEIDCPRLEDDGAYNAMFAVSKYTASVTRSLEIIEALVADEDAVLRNILQYGVEGTHFEVYTDDVTGIDYVRRTAAGQDYQMNVNYTGNVITAFPCPEDGRDLGYADQVKNQNQSAKRNPLYGVSATVLWENAKAAMANYAVCDKIRDTIKAEINELPADSKVFANKKTKEQIISAIPDGYDLDALNNFWWLIRQDVDPTDEKSANVEILDETKAAVRTKRLQLFSAAEDDAEAFIKGAVEASSYYMEKALACETVAELEAICREIEAKNKNSAYSKYLYSDATAGWGTNFYGMLFSPTKEGLGSASLAGAVGVWYSGIQN